ncbi:MAG: hypothetical protein ACLFQ8_02590 [Candidatus Aenigmatarchaeota archaeon]
MNSLDETTVLGKYDDSNLILEKDIANLEDPKAVKDEFLDRGYDEDTWFNVLEYYRRNGSFPHGELGKRADKISARIHEIDDRFLERKFDSEEVNKLYSIASGMDRENNIQRSPLTYHDELKLSDFKDLEALVLDHNVIYGLFENSPQLKFKKQDGTEHIFYVEWQKPLELIDNCLKLQEDVDLRYPGNVFEDASKYCDKNGYNKYLSFEFMKNLKKVGRPLPISYHSERLKETLDCNEDASIILSSSEEYDKFGVVTYDNHFTKNGELEEVIDDIDADMFPLLPDCANLIVKCLRKEDK